jgi:hypothetical protein
VSVVGLLIFLCSPTSTSRKHGKKKPHSFCYCGSFDHYFNSFFGGAIITNIGSLSFKVLTVYSFVDHIFLYSVYLHLRAINFWKLK